MLKNDDICDNLLLSEMESDALRFSWFLLLKILHALMFQVLSKKDTPQFESLWSSSFHLIEVWYHHSDIGYDQKQKRLFHMGWLQLISAFYYSQGTIQNRGVASSNSNKCHELQWPVGYYEDVLNYNQTLQKVM